MSDVGDNRKLPARRRGDRRDILSVRLTGQKHGRAGEQGGPKAPPQATPSSRQPFGRRCELSTRGERSRHPTAPASRRRRHGIWVTGRRGLRVPPSAAFAVKPSRLKEARTSHITPQCRRAAGKHRMREKPCVNNATGWPVPAKPSVRVARSPNLPLSRKRSPLGRDRHRRGSGWSRPPEGAPA